MTDNVMDNITGIEMGSLVIDGSTPTNCIMIQTRRNKYCFRLSEEFPIEKHYEMFRQFVYDVNTPVEQPKAEQPKENKTQWTMDSTQEEPKKEKHDGAKLFDETIPAPTNVEIATQD